ncbi:hypothetical protein O9G_004334 [Rozella allomycis CSF55]|uniref:Protein YIP n=1 Tax=Rozella allomycis (strain CSF55) TaxID=988480 RepID=A0A075B5F2_ROZAC|nr:hypothetical protein O9G_004334 [Rozella allomycis CSF55]|eukprot:EPZ37086.1 hypothetical protein O9G_004334 [Rozella allomycis CSF55]
MNGKYEPLVDVPITNAETANSPKSKLPGFGPTDIPSTSSNQKQTPIAPRLSTLDEPVSATLKRDLFAIWKKITVVLIPRGSENILKDCNDLTISKTRGSMGPIAAMSHARNDNERRSGIVAENGIRLYTCIRHCMDRIGNRYGECVAARRQNSVCALGYCLFPLNVASLVAAFVGTIIVRGPVALASLFWSVTASIKFLGETNLNNRKILAVYPLFLFYFILSWLILIS